jgi:hypothetical protein
MAPRLRFNEGKACDGILRRLEAREGARRTNLRSPKIVLRKSAAS